MRRNCWRVNKPHQLSNIQSLTGKCHVGADCVNARFDVGPARLFLLTDVAGVLNKSGELLTDLDPAAIAALQKDGTISGGMIPKIQTCVDAVQAGVDAAVILDGRTSHAMLIEMFTVKGAGTLIHK
jgi:acetylglutamate kinase